MFLIEHLFTNFARVCYNLFISRTKYGFRDLPLLHLVYAHSQATFNDYNHMSPYSMSAHNFIAIRYECVASLTDRCDLLQLFHSYSSCATRSVQLCRLHVSAYLCQLMIVSDQSLNLWALWSAEICKLISRTNKCQPIDALSLWLSHKFECWLNNSGEDKTFFAAIKKGAARVSEVSVFIFFCD